MINYIHGTLSDIDDGFVVIEAGGVGYGINVPMTVLSGLPAIGSDIKIYTYYSIKEDSHSLYGFLHKEDREMFKRIIRVNGVGPKGALAILSVLRPDELRMAIASGDAKAISRAQGIGLKTAEKLILELKDKIGKINGADILAAGQQASVFAVSSAAGEAIEALTVLGYSRSEAVRVVGLVNVTKEMTTEEVLKLALKNVRM